MVTGGSKGIGLAISQAFGARGARVAIVARGRESLDAAVGTVRTAGASAVLGVSADVRDGADVQRAYREIVEGLGPVDVLVNNAGIHTGFGPFWEIPEEEWLADLTVNLVGVYHWARIVAPAMIERGRGRIINLVGGGFNRAARHMSAYGVSKTAVMRLTENMALELEPHGVAVFALRPGLVDTPGNRAKIAREVVRKWSNLAEILEEKSIPAEKAATLAVALASGRFDALTGRVVYATEDHDALEAKIGGILEGNGRRLAVS
jgi:NAD(P)-dependent dehydrogenase (short-subunit alcohol dehydrogenase family)